MKKFDVKIGGMGCQKCVDSIESAFAGDSRIKQYEVKVGEAIVEGDITKEELKDLIDDAGYDLEEAKEIERL